MADSQSPLGACAVERDFKVGPKAFAKATVLHRERMGECPSSNANRTRSQRHGSPTLLVVTGIVWYQNRSAVEPCALRASRGICGAKHDVAGLSRRDIRLNGWNPELIETK